MNCKFVQPRLSAMIDQELDVREAEVVRAHLMQCMECQREELLLLQVKAMMHDLDQIEPERDFAERILSHVFQTTEAEVKPTRRLPRLVWAVGFAAVFAVGFTFWNHAHQQEAANLAKAHNAELEIAQDRFMLRDGDMTGGAPIISASYVGR